MKKYEYLSIDPDEFIGSSRGMDDQEILDIYGNAGWELTQIYTEPQCHYPVVKIKINKGCKITKISMFINS